MSKTKTPLLIAVVLVAVLAYGLSTAAQSGVTSQTCADEHSSPAGDFVTAPRDIDGDGIAETCVLDNYFGSERGVGSALKRLQTEHPEEYACHLAAVLAGQPSNCSTVTPVATPVPPPVQSAWQFLPPADEVGLDGPVTTAFTETTTNDIGSGFGADDVFLIVHCVHNTGRLSIGLVFIGDFVFIGSAVDPDVRYRFDSGPTISETWGVNRDNDTVSQRSSNHARFLQGLRTSNKVTVEVTDWFNDRNTADFNVAGFSTVIEPGIGGCL